MIEFVEQGLVRSQHRPLVSTKPSEPEHKQKQVYVDLQQQALYSQCPHILLDGIELEQVSHFKYLGVWISANLTWSKHIMSVTCKARRLLGYIFRAFSPHCSPSAIMTIYRAQVHLGPPV